MKRLGLAASALMFAASLGACAQSSAAKTALSESQRPPSTAALRHARARLVELRAEAQSSSSEPYTVRLRLGLREPFSGRWMEARGAAAIDAPHTLRMILLGPGGTTAMDLWIQDERYRLAVPAADLVVRSGDKKGTPIPGMPVDFLRSWLLTPLAGSLLWTWTDAEGEHFLLRDGAAIVQLCSRKNGSLAVRRETWSTDRLTSNVVRSELETVEATALGCGRARYTQASTGLVVDVVCEGIDLNKRPSSRAFEDPDGVEKAP